MKNILLALALMVATSQTIAAQICNPAISKTTEQTRYQLLNDGAEVKDQKTGLIWQRCTVGQTLTANSCTGEAALYTWQEAQDYAKKQANQWRVPTIDELKTLHEAACIGPAINEATFVDTPLNNETWSASAEGADYGIMLSFYNGEVSSNDKLNTLYVRLVKTAP
ncbi:DUF1566 domain-containing protein [Agitococcus lubricus]|uniref:Uncharacterized protein DUF1566 n=1 Tax=Agitococcus lubricus TaxID=1077255 RepID=A0A2T5IUK8_9GAMM|nr:DUF1566 domain-containing protein [Agitococcus lubricus]PTQ87547.1 uncharacterized protein DUF1566 [Agitococcus lubricus]